MPHSFHPHTEIIEMMLHAKAVVVYLVVCAGCGYTPEDHFGDVDLHHVADLALDLGFCVVDDLVLCANCHERRASDKPTS